MNYYKIEIGDNEPYSHIFGCSLTENELLDLLDLYRERFSENEDNEPSKEDFYAFLNSKGIKHEEISIITVDF